MYFLRIFVIPTDFAFIENAVCRVDGRMCSRCLPMFKPLCIPPLDRLLTLHTFVVTLGVNYFFIAMSMCLL